MYLLTDIEKLSVKNICEIANNLCPQKFFQMFVNQLFLAVKEINKMTTCSQNWIFNEPLNNKIHELCIFGEVEKLLKYAESYVIFY